MLTDIQKGLAERRAKTRRDDEIREEIFDRFDIKTEGLSDLSEEALAEMMLKLGGIAIDTADEARNKPPEMFVHFVPIPRRSNARWQYGMMQIGARHNTGDKTVYYPAVVVEVRWATDQMDSATRQPNEDAIIHVATNDIKRGYLIGKAIAGGDEGVRALVIGDTREALARGFVIPTDATEDQKATIDKKLDEAVEKDLAGTFTLQDGTVRTQLEQRTLNVLAQADSLANPAKRQYQSVFAITDRNVAREAGGGQPRNVWGMHHPTYLRRVFPGYEAPQAIPNEGPAEMPSDVPVDGDSTQF